MTRENSMRISSKYTSILYTRPPHAPESSKTRVFMLRAHIKANWVESLTDLFERARSYCTKKNLAKFPRPHRGDLRIVKIIENVTTTTYTAVQEFVSIFRNIIVVKRKEKFNSQSGAYLLHPLGNEK